MLNGWLLAAYITAQSFDISTTGINLYHGCHEQVWPTQNPWVIGGVKATAVAITLPVSRKFKKVGIVIAALGIASGTYGGVHNIRVAPFCHK